MSSPKASPFIWTVALALAFPLVSAKAGDFTSYMLNGDSNSRINSGLTYTVKADLNGGTPTINGVTFTDTGTSGTGYALGGGLNAFPGFVNNATGNMNGVLSNFFYTGDGTGNSSLTLSGLTPGTQYVSTFYNASFGGYRYIDITPSDTGTVFRYNEDNTILRNASMLKYAYTAPASGTLTFSFDAVSNGDSFHFYGLTNEVRNDVLAGYTHFSPVTAAITRVSGSTTPFTVSNTDLLQTHLSGTVTTTGNFNREPVLGATSVMANGSFSITGIGANNPELVTGENNATATYNLDLGFSPLGYDVTSIAGYGGWNDAGRDLQKYSVFVSLVGSPDWILYGQVDDNPTSPSGISAVRAVMTGSISGVDAVRIDFLDAQENGYAGYGEFDVFGTATVPEPGSLACLMLGGLGLMARRRRA